MKKPVSSVVIRVFATIGKIIIFGGTMYFLAWIYFLLFFLITPKYYFASLGFVLAFIVLIIAWIITNKKARRVVLIVFLSITTTTALTLGCIGISDAYRYSKILVDNTSIDTDAYLPFDKNSKIARLDKKASLQFSILDQLPVLDGAAALFPMYSAFVNATYPSNIEPLNAPGSPFTYNNTILGYTKLFKEENDIMFGAAPDQYMVDDAKQIVGEFELNMTPIGKEGFVFFTNVNNHVDSLTMEQIRGIYNGDITNWREVGGADVKILPYIRNPGSGSQTAFSKYFPDVSNSNTPKELVANAMSGIVEIISDYHNYPGAIGFSFYYYATALKKANDIKILSINGVEPNKTNISNDSYPMSDCFYATYREGNRKTENIQKLINWILSDEGQELVDKSGYSRING